MPGTSVFGDTSGVPGIEPLGRASWLGAGVATAALAAGALPWPVLKIVPFSLVILLGASAALAAAAAVPGGAAPKTPTLSLAILPGARAALAAAAAPVDGVPNTALP